MERDCIVYDNSGLVKISTHTLTWSVTENGYGRTSAHMHFNSHAHVERDRTGGRSGWHTSDFNSHAHVERDSIVFNQIFQPRNFNSHAHVERDRCIDRCTECNQYFNSHAHVERDGVYVIYPLDRRISTHTLTWSVTCVF